MLRHQSQLPLLPVPTLEETAAKYLRTVRPFLSDADYERTHALVHSFIGHGEGSVSHDSSALAHDGGTLAHDSGNTLSDGQRLQKRLLERVAIAGRIPADFHPTLSRPRVDLSDVTSKSCDDLSASRQNQLGICACDAETVTIGKKRITRPSTFERCCDAVKTINEVRPTKNR